MTIQLSHIHKTIGRQFILQDISLSVGQGEVIGLLGPNGAGKSTLMKILVGLWPATSGEVEVCGINLNQCAHDVAPYIGYLPENNPLYEDMYIREYLEFMASVSMTQKSGEGKPQKLTNPKARVEEVIAMVGLQPEISKTIGQLSKGYRQRVGLAQALLQDPQLLILDEPTTGLDPNQLEDIRALIRDLGKNRTVILSTHILQEVKQMCSRVLILSHGQLKADMPIQEIENLETLFREKTYEGEH
ncbi:MAG: ABC transporter ATP-binding protein [Paludibacteraceae bacterium]|nr:ABC transporter ATP-binding protein [Paludibacteraceae bacterium]